MTSSEPVQGTRKVFIDHLDKMKPLRFLEFIKRIEEEHNGILSHSSCNITEKIDGSALRFGLDDRGRFFMESATSPPAFYSGDFEKYARGRGYTNHIGPCFDHMLWLMKNDLDLTDILKKYSDNGIKIVGELLYPGLATETTELTTTFVRIPYYTHRLGKIWTFIPIMILDGEGKRHRDEDKIIRELLVISSGDRMYVHPMAQLLGVIDLRHEIVDLNYCTYELTKDIHRILKSRKKADFELKKLTINEIGYHQKRFSEVILGCIMGGILGPYFEGVVIEFKDGSIIKVITPKFQNTTSTL